MTHVFEIFPHARQELLHSQYYGCWCLGDARSQGISNHDVHFVEQELFGPCMFRIYVSNWMPYSYDSISIADRSVSGSGLFTVSGKPSRERHAIEATLPKTTALMPSLLWKQNVSVAYSSDVKMSTMASQITSRTIVYSAVYSGADQRKHQSSASQAFVRRIPRTKGQ